MEQKQVTDQADFRKGNLERVGGKIDLAKAESWIANYNKLQKTTSHFFGRNTIESILRQPGCSGIRIHYAVDDSGHKQLLLTGVDSVGKDQITHPIHRHEVSTIENSLHANASSNNDENGFYDQSWPCPETRGC